MHLTGIYCYISYNNDAIMTVTAITPHFIVRQMFRYKSKGEIIVYRNIYMWIAICENSLDIKNEQIS